MKIVYILLLAVFGLASCHHNVGHHWDIFKEKFDKSYSPEEDLERKAIFESNLEMISKHNIEHQLGLKSYQLGLNEFTDMSDEEFIESFTGYKMISNEHLGEPLELPEDMDFPDSLDYRTEGVLTPVKNQGHCGSCWAFSTTGAIEGQYALKTGKLISLSEQQLVDCTYKNHNGCKGGQMETAFEYIHRVGGIDSEKAYPYSAKSHFFCHFRKSKVAVQIQGFQNVPREDEIALQKALVMYGPVSVAIEATPQFKHYKTGVLNASDCSGNPRRLNHAVLLVGYGTEEGQDYWLIKNSWGPEYGDGGYMKMIRGSNHCGIAVAASVPIL